MASRTMEPPPVIEPTEEDSLSAYGAARSTIQGKPSTPRHCEKSTTTPTGRLCRCSLEGTCSVMGSGRPGPNAECGLPRLYNRSIRHP
jgi:hypothetical protein